jgi:hypothetical protein
VRAAIEALVVQRVELEPAHRAGSPDALAAAQALDAALAAQVLDAYALSATERELIALG